MIYDNIYRKEKYFYKNPNNVFNNKNRLPKTKTYTFLYNSKYKPNKIVYIKLDPENLEKNYKKENPKIFRYGNEKDYSYNQNNSINYNHNNNLFKKSFNLSNSKENSFFKYNQNNINFSNNEIYNNKTNSFSKRNKKLKIISPIKNFIEKNNFNIYINSGKNEFKNNNSQEFFYMNKSKEYKIPDNNCLNNNNKKMINNNFRNNQRFKYNNFLLLNIYQNKLITIFIKIIYKIILKENKNLIISFFNKLKNNNNKNNTIKNEVKFCVDKYKQKDPKYNEFKDIIYNYVKTKHNLPMGAINKLSEREQQIFNNITNRNKNINSQNNNINVSKSKKNNSKSDLKRFKELQKKYEKIYERKKSSNKSLEDKFKNYLKNHRTNLNSSKKMSDNKVNLSDLNRDNDNNNLKEKIMDRRKLFNELNKNNHKYPKNNLQEFNSSFNFKNPNKFYSISNSPKKENTSNEKNNHINNRIRVNKLKVTPKYSNNSRKKNSDCLENKKDIYEVYNIKDIVTSDKRLYVYINYITLYKKNNVNNKLNFYDNNLLKISNKININYLNPYSIKKRKKLLNKIIEEKDDNEYNSQNEVEDKDKNNLKKIEDKKSFINSNKDGKKNTNNKIIKLNKIKNNEIQNKRYSSNYKEDDIKNNNKIDNNEENENIIISK